MRAFHRAVLVLLLISVSGCSLTKRRQCETWIGDGPYISSVDSCVECAKTYGTGQKDLVMGCAIGLDATRLLVR